MKKVSSLIAIAAIAGATVYEPPMPRKEYVKPPLTPKEKKARAKNKLAKKARKQNRNK